MTDYSTGQSRICLLGAATSRQSSAVSGRAMILTGSQITARFRKRPVSWWQVKSYG
jgi:hypothetical protein